MTSAEKLQLIAENEQRVYDAGYQSGYDVGYEDGEADGYRNGNEEAYNEFWDVFQNNGGTANYYVAFAYNKFTDANYNPKYPIKCSNGTTPGQQMFYGSRNITDTKVAIYANNNNINGAFSNCTSLKTIRLLSVHATTEFPSTFVECTALENIVIEGTIGKDIAFNYSKKLTHDSIVSIMTALSTTTSAYTVRFAKSAVNKAFETSEGANDGSTSAEWLALANTRTNWTISLV
jgi:hypothetical protein